METSKNTCTFKGIEYIAVAIEGEANCDDCAGTLKGICLDLGSCRSQFREDKRNIYWTTKEDVEIIKGVKEKVKNYTLNKLIKSVECGNIDISDAVFSAYKLGKEEN